MYRGEVLGCQLTVLNDGIPLARHEQKSLESAEDRGGLPAPQPSAEQLPQKCRRVLVLPPTTGGAREWLPPLLSAQSYCCSCCLQFPRASKGEAKIRDERSRNTQDNPEEIRLLEAARQASFTSLFSISSSSSEIIAFFSPPLHYPIFN